MKDFCEFLVPVMILYATKVVFWKYRPSRGESVAIYGVVVVALLPYVYWIVDWHNTDISRDFNLYIWPLMVFSAPTTTFIWDLFRNRDNSSWTTRHIVLRLVVDSALYPLCMVACAALGFCLGWISI